MGTAMYAQAQASASEGAATSEDSSGGGSADDDVVDAEIVDEDKPAEGGAA
jgi:molecular chaperone DnaK